MKPTVSDFHETFRDFGTGHSEQNDTHINEFDAGGQKLWPTKNRHFVFTQALKFIKILTIIF